MVYQRYVNGYGPYSYKSVREGDTVHSIYLGGAMFHDESARLTGADADAIKNNVEAKRSVTKNKPKTINTPSNQVGSGEKMQNRERNLAEIIRANEGRPMKGDPTGELTTSEKQHYENYLSQHERERVNYEKFMEEHGEGPEEGYGKHGEILPSTTKPAATGFQRNSTPNAKAFAATGENFKQHYSTLSRSNQSMIYAELGWKEGGHFNMVMEGREKPTEEEMEKWARIARAQKFVWQP